MAIYLEARLWAAPGKMGELVEYLEKEFVPDCEKLGRKLAGQWRTTTGEVEEVTNLWVYEDLADMMRYDQRAQAERAKDPEFGKRGAKLATLVLRDFTRVMVPTRVSPLK